MFLASTRYRTSAAPILAASLMSASLAHAAPVDTKGVPIIAPGSAYIQTNQISDVQGLALVRDTLLVNPWGITVRGTSPFWVANSETSTSRLYRGTSTLIVNPGLSGITVPGGLPTGAVGNSTSDFVVTSGMASGAANFIFASITGNIVGWNPNVPAAGSTQGVIMASHPGHVMTGLATGNNGSNKLYGADFANDHIDVFNATYGLTTVSGNFNDATIPAGYAPYNIQNLGGLLYVAYAKVGANGRAENGVGKGYVRRFNTDGVRDLTFAINTGALDAPWGLAIAPASFGIFSNALLVGNNSDDGTIHAYNPTTGAFLGTLQDEGGVALKIDQLWGLIKGNGVDGGDANTVYFTAGIGHEDHGLLGSLKPTTASATSLIEFSSATYQVNEYANSITITVLRSGAVDGTASVSYSGYGEVNNVGYASPADFALSPGTLSFGAGETSKTFSVSPLNDNTIEVNEVLALTLSNAVGAGLSANEAELTITDPGVFVNGFE